jgi:hypothetical protein
MNAHTRDAALTRCQQMSYASVNAELRAEREANARLIAAAPELLATLKALADAPNADAAHNIAQDALRLIAKVEGQ